MKFYVATRAIVDAVNGYQISSGTMIRTENLRWIKRFGSAFREIAVPESPEVLEDVVFIRSDNEAPVVADSVQSEAPVATQAEPAEEAVDGDDSASEAEEDTESDTMTTRDLNPRKRVKRKSSKK